MDLQISDKAFLVVGGTNGIGLAAAKALANEGAAVAVVGRDIERGEAAAAEVRGAGASAVHPLAFDVSAPGQAGEAVAEAVGKLGRLDGLAVTTGLIGHEPIEISDEEWTAVCVRT